MKIMMLCFMAQAIIPLADWSKWRCYTVANSVLDGTTNCLFKAMI
jgi:hypothetical protein